MAHKKIIKKKIEIVFDPRKRLDFLTGFRKRKNERRKKAKELLERNLKEERKRIRLEVKDGLKHMKKSFEPLKELTDKDKEEEYEDEDVKIKIVELTTNDLAARVNLIGENRIDLDESDETEDEVFASKHDPNLIPGMDFDVYPKISKIKGVNRRSEQKVKNEIRTKKELDRFKKIKTLKKFKKSKAFQVKKRIEKKVNQKKAKREKNDTIRSLPKNQRKQKKLETSRYRKGKLVNKKQLRRKCD